MTAKSNISRKVMLSAFGLPMLGVYMLSIWCGLGNFLAECCEHHDSGKVEHHAAVHEHTDDHHHDSHHHDHQSDDHHNHNHSGHHQEDDQGDDGCCSDVTTAFFLVFQQQVQPYTVDFQSADNPVALLPVFVNQYLPNVEVHPLQKWLSPPRPAPSGFKLRILHQSFLI
jgi:hypothetical protein